MSPTNVMTWPQNAVALGFDVPVDALIHRQTWCARPQAGDSAGAAFGLLAGRSRSSRKSPSTPTTPGRDPTITRQGEPPSTKSVRVGEKVEILVKVDHAGPNIVEIEAEAAPGEAHHRERSGGATVEGVRENLRVRRFPGASCRLSAPGATAETDAVVDLVHFMILRPPEKQDGTPINQCRPSPSHPRAVPGEARSVRPTIFDRYQRRGVLPLLDPEEERRPLRGARRRVLARPATTTPRRQPVPVASRPDPPRCALWAVVEENTSRNPPARREVSCDDVIVRFKGRGSSWGPWSAWSKLTPRCRSADEGVPKTNRRCGSANAARARGFAFLDQIPLRRVAHQVLALYRPLAPACRSADEGQDLEEEMPEATGAARR